MEIECEWFVDRKDGEVPGLQHVPKVPQSLINMQEFPVVCAVLLLDRAQLPGEECEGLPDVYTRCWRTAPMAVVDASVTSASGAVGSGLARRAA